MNGPEPVSVAQHDLIALTVGVVASVVYNEGVIGQLAIEGVFFEDVEEVERMGPLRESWPCQGKGEG